MAPHSDRYHRNILLFGEEGQRKLRSIAVTIVGVGGLGSLVVQQLALLGVGAVTPIDDEELDNTNRNRFAGARHDDPVPGSPKVHLVSRLVREINPDVAVRPLQTGLVTPSAFDAVKSADWVFGCFDDDGPRFILNELCIAYGKPYVDLASDLPGPGEYGGRVCVVREDTGCLVCQERVDLDDVQRYLSSEAEQHARDAIYGVSRDALGQTGPSVAPLNGIIASLAVMEFMLAVTGIAEPRPVLNYVGHVPRLGKIRMPRADCSYCALRGLADEADVERYLRMRHLAVVACNHRAFCSQTSAISARIICE